MKKQQQIFVLDSPDAMAGFVLQEWKRIASEAVLERGYFTAAVSGGKTPVSLYRKLADADGGLPWDRTHLFLVDERIVPYSHPDSNWGMVAATLLRAAGIPAGNCHPILVENPLPEMSAARYEKEITSFFGPRHEGLPVFDLMLLGMGADGHTASLFPGHAAVKESGRLVTAVILDDTRHARITMTLPLINRSENIFFLVSGQDKSEVIKKVVLQNDTHLPSALVKPLSGNCIFVLDREAASGLPGEMLEEAR